MDSLYLSCICTVCTMYRIGFTYLSVIIYFICYGENIQSLYTSSFKKSHSSSFLWTITLQLKLNINHSSSLSVLTSSRPLETKIPKIVIDVHFLKNHCVLLCIEIELCLQERHYNKAILSHYLKFNK